jgi:alpha-L-rhamnosidase
MDVASFFTKWLGDLAADQTDEGGIPDVVPDVLGGNASTGWADAGVIIPWTVYLVYGDTRILEVQYQSMKAWVEYMRRESGDNFLWQSGSHYGDWLAYATTRSDYPGATTDKDLIATGFFGYSTSLLEKISRVLGKEADAQRYAGLLENIKSAFQDEFVTKRGRLSSNTQTAYTLALNFSLLPADLRTQAAARLARDVRAFDNHLTTGFLGTPYLCHVLSRYGHLDVAYDLLNQETYPSWLYPVKQGATTIWERWDGIRPDGSFQDAGMNSFNHYAYGAIGEWLYRVVAGIEVNPAQPGYKHVVIAPQPGGGLSQVRASFDSIHGRIESNWELVGDLFRLTVTIPANTRATVRLPGAEQDKVTENAIPLSEIRGVAGYSERERTVTVDVGSGEYSFEYESPDLAAVIKSEGE